MCYVLRHVGRILGQEIRFLDRVLFRWLNRLDFGGAADFGFSVVGSNFRCARLICRRGSFIEYLYQRVEYFVQVDYVHMSLTTEVRL